MRSRTFRFLKICDPQKFLPVTLQLPHNVPFFSESKISFSREIPNSRIICPKGSYKVYESILCSLNLYDYSKDVNIEAGYLIYNDSPKKIREEQNSAWDFFFNIFIRKICLRRRILNSLYAAFEPRVLTTPYGIKQSFETNIGK